MFYKDTYIYSKIHRSAVKLNYRTFLKTPKEKIKILSQPGTKEVCLLRSSYVRHFFIKDGK